MKLVRRITSAVMSFMVAVTAAIPNIQTASAADYSMNSGNTVVENLNRGIEIIKLNDSYQMCTKKCLYEYISPIFDKKSKPYGMINGTTMIIACENAAVVQELTLRKRQILKKYTPYVKSLNITLKDIMFDAKKWNKVTN